MPATTTVRRAPAVGPVLARVRVARTARLSPSFVRLELAAPELADLGVDGPLLDQRVKLLLPSPGRGLPRLEEAGPDWYAAWRRLPEGERGDLRTYTARALSGAGAETRLVVDVVVHEGASGPGARFAAQAAPGDEVLLVGPRRGEPFGGIEFAPGPHRRLLLVADETAVPAVCGILEALPADAQGAVFLEVPYAADVLPVRRPPGVELTWLVRAGAAHGARLHRAVLDHLGAAAGDQPAHGDPAVVAEAEVDPDLWETPTYSSSGADPGGDGAGVAGATGDLYAWIAGESALVTALRRALVRDLGVDRRQVAFMGYWRRGVAMG